MKQANETKLAELVREFNVASRINADTKFTPYLKATGEIVFNDYFIVLNEWPSFNGMFQTLSEFAIKYNASLTKHPNNYRSELCIRISVYSDTLEK